MAAPPAPAGLIASRALRPIGTRRIRGRRLPKPGRLLLYLLLVSGAALMMSRSCGCC